MSHYIHDNQAVVITSDNKILLFIKGGDNNCFSYNNKRITSWHLNNTFSNEDEYYSYITELLMTDISGGSWQFASLKNKTFNGFTEYDNTIYNRFESALKNAIVITDWKISDINTSNVYEFEKAVMNLFRSKNISLKDESGIENGLGFIWSYTDDVTKEEAAINRLQKSNGFKEKRGSKEYKDFCKKYANERIEILVNDIMFCSAIAKFDKSYNKSVSVLEKLRGTVTTNNVDFACFNLLVHNNEKTVLDLLSSYYMKSLLESYPIQFETLNCLDQFHQKVNNILSSERQKDNDYMLNRYEKNYNLIVNADYKILKENINDKIKEIEANAKDKFIELWNGLIADSWYKTTNDRLPRKVSELNDAFSTNTFNLEDIKNECEDNFDKLFVHYDNQYKKNQVAIKKVFKDLIYKYSILFDEKSIDNLCTYFKYKKPLQEKIIEINVEIEEQNNVTKVTQLSLFDFAA